MQQFPVFKIKVPGDNKVFNLDDPRQVDEYFQHKIGPEIAKIKEYLRGNTFVAYLLGKKNAGKGTYSKIFMNLFSPDKVGHISVGDIVRGVDEEMKDPKKRASLVDFLKKNYRGYLSLEEILKSQEGRGTGKPLLPTEYILALLKREIAKVGKKALFIDGLPRTLDQVSYSLFFRELIGFREDPDMFILFEVPESVIDERLKYRVVCPICHTPRNLKLFVTSKIGYDEKEQKFYLICDSAECKSARMIPKEGDELGIEAIRERLISDQQLIEQAFSLYGVPKVLLRNTVPVHEAIDMVNDYEITPAYETKYDEVNKKVSVFKTAYVVKDDFGIESYSLMAPAVAVSLVKQIADVLGL